MGTATFVMRQDGSGEGRVYKVDPPVEYRTYNYYTGKHEDKTTDHVWVSAVDAYFSGPETYIFPADENGDVLDFGELPGSFTGDKDHERALRDAGYTNIITTEEAA